MSSLHLLTVGDLMHLVISEEKLLDIEEGGMQELGAVGPLHLTLFQKAALLCHVVRR